MGDTESTDSLSGKQVGNYKATRMLGKGSMGEVYEGTHPILNKRVAIKVLSPELSQYPELVSRFRREARAIAGIKHPAIVEAFDFGNLADGRCYYVMEFLEGSNLATYMLANGALPVQEAVDIGVQLMEGLAAAHEAGFIHRDIKPDNIFLVRTEEGKMVPKLIDFGIAKLRDPDEQGDSVVTRIDAVMGTPLYMSPEQAPGSNEPVGPWSDIYSTGATMYHVIGGKPPLYSDNPLELMLMHSWSPPPPLCEIRPDVPQAVSDVIMKALAKQPAERFQSMEAFGAAFAAAGAGKPLAAEVPVSGIDDTVIEGIALEVVSDGAAEEGAGVGDGEGGSAPAPAVPAEKPLARRPKTAETPVAATASDLKTPVSLEAAPAGEPPADIDEPPTLEDDARSGPSNTSLSEAAAEHVIEAGAPDATMFASQTPKRSWKPWVLGGGAAGAAVLVAVVLISRGGGGAAPGPPRWSILAAGDSHTCAVRRGSGALYCWGRNQAGQLGSGDLMGRSRPVPVRGIGAVTQVTAGGSHSCALTREEQVWCWGGGSLGQLGTGDLNPRVLPTRVAGVGKCTHVAAGRSHTCSLTEEGRVWCWGDNSAGQVGAGRRGAPQASPAMVRDLIAVVALDAGGDRTCAITANGSVWCWGRPTGGDPKGAAPGGSTVGVPRKVEGVAGAKAVAVAPDHACALTEAGKVLCWGRGGRGQLGNGAATPWSPPGPVLGLQGVLQVAVGGTPEAGHSCAVDRAGALWCWGDGRHGQTGRSPGPAPGTRSERVAGLKDVATLAAGRAHTCAVTREGKLYCFGANPHGQLGTGDVVERGQPLEVR